MRRIFSFVLTMILLSSNIVFADNNKVILGNERLISEYSHLINNKNIGVITNQTGINSKGENTYEVLYNYKKTNLKALYTPEHGLDGLTKAGKYIESSVHPKYNIPVYSLYGPNRMIAEHMLKDIDVLIFDIQDIGSRTYTYISTLNYSMIAAKKYNKKIIVLDRPNPVGGHIVEGFTLEPKYKSFVGIDAMPMAHGMTVGEIAKFFNRNIDCDLQIITMKNYYRDMVYQDTNLPWKMTSPNIPDLDSAFGYMATGIGSGTGVGQGEKFKFIGSSAIKNSNEFANLLNSSSLEGVKFIPKTIGSRNGVALKITDYKKFNPCKTGIYALTYAHKLTNFEVPKSKNNIIMFEKIIGTDKFGKLLESHTSPKEIVNSYQDDLNKFLKLRSKYLIYDYSNKNIDKETTLNTVENKNHVDYLFE
ncbi:DUF1343 domain-containing protein [Peptostreptococcaceae bacterium AGR-M142]